MNFLFSMLAKLLAIPAVANWIIARAQRTPYFHLTSPDGRSIYMFRWWLFNPYHDSEGRPVRRNWLMRRLPSMRVHHIMRADDDRHNHDHPWDARTFILRNSYHEIRPWDSSDPTGPTGTHHMRLAGDTATLKHGEYHRIVWVPPEGAITLFVTYKYQGDWGFMVNGEKIPHKEYFAHPEKYR